MARSKRLTFYALLMVVLMPGLLHAGGVKFASGNPLDMDGNRINNLGSPVANDDAASKEYVDLEVSAATAAVRTPISVLPFTVSVSGSYYVTGNLDGSAGGIVISASDVSLDLMGFTLDGGGVAAGLGIDLGSQENVTIMNGSIRDFGASGIYSATGSKHVKLIDLQLLGNGWSNDFPGINLRGHNALILRCSAVDGGSDGIYVYQNSRILDSSACDNVGFGIAASSGSILTNNVAIRNGEEGIECAYGCTLTNNAATANGWTGIKARDGSILRGNVAKQNNTSENASYAGFSIAVDSFVADNTADDNRRTGFMVEGADNVLRNNHATDSVAVGGVSDCFNFSYADNAAIGNTATGCTTGFAGSFPTTINRENDAW